MPGLLTLHVFATDLSATQSRALLDWCLARGADTFTVGIVGARPAFEQYGNILDQRLARYAVSASSIPAVPEGQPGARWASPQQLWRLNAASAEILWSELKGGLLNYYSNGEAWLEDPALYRGPDLMLGIVSHESEGVLRIRPEEQALLDGANIPYRHIGEWIEY
jgi:hypothetical protein